MQLWLYPGYMGGGVGSLTLWAGLFLSSDADCGRPGERKAAAAGLGQCVLQG